MNGAGGAIGSSVQVSSTVSGPSNDPDVVWNGSVFGVLWTYRLSDNDKRFRLVGADGVPIDVPVDVVDWSSSDAYHDLAWSGSEFVMVWQSDHYGYFEILMQRLQFCQ